jgi:YVTN family beta-propeller protein
MRRALVLALLLVPAAAEAAPKRSSSAIALSPDGATLVVVNPDSGTVSLVDTGTLEVQAELAVGRDPRTAAIADDGRRAAVAAHGADTVAVIDLRTRTVVGEVEVGWRPYGVVAIPGGPRFVVAVQGDDRVVLVDALRLAVTAQVTVADRPSGLAVSSDGELLLVTHLLAGTVTVVNLPDLEIDALVPLWPDSNLAQSIVISRDTAFVAHTRANTPNTALTFDTTVFPIVSVLDVPSRRHLVGPHLNLDTLDPPGVGLPFDAAVSPDGDVLWVVNAASNDITVVDLLSHQRLAHIEVGDNPRAVVLDTDGSRAFVNNTLAGTVSIIDAASFTVTETLEVTSSPLPPAMLLGKRLFHSSHDPRMARDQWIACSSCHFDGEHDGRTWTFGFAGPRNTTSLRGAIQTYPLRWSAEWDESADSEFAVTREQFGSGLLAGTMHEPLAAPNTGRSYELDCLAAFVDSLMLPSHPTAEPADPAALLRGQVLFHDPVVGCSDCHPPPYWTDFEAHDVGTADGPRERLGPEIDTPSLRAMADSAPYLHDGSAATLMEVLTTTNPDDLHGVTSHLDPADLEALVAYMLILPVNNSACVGCPLPRSPPGSCAGRGATARQAGEERPRRPAGRATGSELVSGRVVSAATDLPVPQALVTVRATTIQTTSAGDGSFTLRVPPTDGEIEVTAWADGFYIASEHAHVPASGVELELRRHHTDDNPDYDWIDPSPDPGSDAACANCHPMILPQWQGNAHGGAISNPRFFSFYNGTDVTGARTVAPGYRLDFPGTTGNCATCHAPGAAVDAPFTTDMNTVRGQLAAGIHCDFCHKIGGAYLEAVRPQSTDCTPCHKHARRSFPAASWATYDNMPGVLSLEVLRPPEGEQIFIGPYPDIHDPDTYLPLMSDSALCAPCHQFSFWGTPIYTSYDEWRASPYADPVSGQTCQDCHMPPTGDTHFALPEEGGLPHPPETIPSHLQVGVTDQDLMRQTVELTIETSHSDDTLQVSVTVTNVGAGHHVPTDHPGRHLILEVIAADQSGRPLPLVEGPTVPPWGGSFAGRAGTAFAKVLEDVVSGEWPVVSYWKQAVIREDTRIPALGRATTSYTFAGDADATVTARVVFRRLFEPIADRYGWDLDEIVMAEQVATVSPP